MEINWQNYEERFDEAIMGSFCNFLERVFRECCTDHFLDSTHSCVANEDQQERLEMYSQSLKNDSGVTRDSDNMATMSSLAVPLSLISKAAFFFK